MLSDLDRCLNLTQKLIKSSPRSHRLFPNNQNRHQLTQKLVFANLSSDAVYKNSLFANTGTILNKATASATQKEFMSLVAIIKKRKLKETAELLVFRLSIRLLIRLLTAVPPECVVKTSNSTTFNIKTKKQSPYFVPNFSHFRNISE